MNSLASTELSQVAGVIDSEDLKEKIMEASRRVREMEAHLGIRREPQISHSMQIVSGHLQTVQDLLREGRTKEALLLIRGAEVEIAKEAGGGKSS